MDNSITNYIVPTHNLDWQPLVEKGVDTAGIFVKPLRLDTQSSRSPSIMLKFQPGSHYPYHNHPAGEEIFVLEGEVTIEGATLRAGDYLYTPPGFRHSVSSANGAVLLLFIPEEVEIL